jgi:hypothetical protein
VRDRKVGLTQQPKAANAALLVAVLPPQSLIIGLPGPLNFNCDLGLAFLSKNIGPPFAIWRLPGDLGFGCPSLSANRFNDQVFQFQMYCCFAAVVADAKHPMSEEACS